MTVRTIDDLVPYDRNANRGSDRGRSVIQNSMEKRGTGRSVVADKNGKLIAGRNATAVAKLLGKGIRVVETDGDELLVHVRRDLDIETDEAAQLLAIDDNRAGQVGLEWNTDIIEEDLDAGLDLTDAGFDLTDIETMLEDAKALTPIATGSKADGEGDDKMRVSRMPTVKPVLKVDQVAIFEEALRSTGLRSRGDALIKVCQFFLSGGDEAGGQPGDDDFGDGL